MKDPEEALKLAKLARPSLGFDQQMQGIFAGAAAANRRRRLRRPFFIASILGAVGAACIAFWPTRPTAAVQKPLIYRIRAEGDLRRLLLAPEVTAPPASNWHVKIVTQPL